LCPVSDGGAASDKTNSIKEIAMRRNKNGERLCDSKDCEFIATHTLVWTKQQYYCMVCANGMLNIGAAMGFPTPASTIRPMTPDEYYVGPDDAGEGEDD